MLSVVIPTLNEEQHIEDLLAAVTVQLAPADELLVVDGESTDGTVALAEQYADAVHITSPAGIGAARTTGAREARNPYVAFLDADTMPVADWVDRAKAHLRHGATAVTGLGLYEAPQPRRTVYNAFSRLVFRSGHLSYALARLPFMIDNNLAIDRDLFLSTGGYRSVVAESVDLGLKLQACDPTIVYDPHMRVRYSSRRFEERGFLRTVNMWAKGTLSVFRGSGASAERYSRWRLE